MVHTWTWFKRTGTNGISGSCCLVFPLIWFKERKQKKDLKPKLPQERPQKQLHQPEVLAYHTHRAARRACTIALISLIIADGLLVSYRPRNESLSECYMHEQKAGLLLKHAGHLLTRVWGWLRLRGQESCCTTIKWEIVNMIYKMTCIISWFGSTRRLRGGRAICAIINSFENKDKAYVRWTLWVLLWCRGH